MIRHLLLWLLVSVCGTSFAQPVAAIGALKQVKQAGQLSGVVRPDTLSGQSIYGLGPVAYLRGEILVWNDTAYVSRVENGKNVVNIQPSVAAPFFAYASVTGWADPFPIADSITALLQLQQLIEKYAVATGRSLEEPFPFVLRGTVPQLTYHVMNKPKAQTEHNPDLHRQAKQFYKLEAEEVQLLGFYSRQHEGVFTHHGSYIHVHVINQSRTKMGHLDEIFAFPTDLSVAFPVSNH